MQRNEDAGVCLFEELEHRIVLTVSGVHAVGYEYGDFGLRIYNGFGATDTETDSSVTLSGGLSRFFSDGGSDSLIQGFSFGGPKNGMGLDFGLNSDPYENRMSVGFKDTGLGWSLGWDTGFESFDLTYFTPFADLVTDPPLSAVDGDFVSSGLYGLPFSSMDQAFGTAHTNLDNGDLTGNISTDNQAIAGLAIAEALTALFADGFSQTNLGATLQFGPLAAIGLGFNSGGPVESLSVGARVTNTSMTADMLIGKSFAFAFASDAGLSLKTDRAWDTGAGADIYVDMLRLRPNGQAEMISLAEARGQTDTSTAGESSELGSWSVSGNTLTLEIYSNMDPELSAVFYEFTITDDMSALIPAGHRAEGGPSSFDFGAGIRVMADEDLNVLTPVAGGGDMLIDFGSIDSFTKRYDADTRLADLILRNPSDELRLIRLSSILGMEFLFEPRLYIEDDGQGVQGIGQTAQGFESFRWGLDGTSTRLNLSLAVEYNYKFQPSYTESQDGSMAFALGFNGGDHFIQYETHRQDMNGDGLFDWLYTNLGSNLQTDDSAVPAGNGVAAADYTPWGGLSYYYVSEALDLWSIWTAPGLDRFFGNNLSEIAGAGDIGGMQIAPVSTDWLSAHVGYINTDGTFKQIWWNWSFGGDWFVDDTGTNFGDPTFGMYLAGVTNSQQQSIDFFAVDNDTWSLNTISWYGANDMWMRDDLGQRIEAGFSGAIMPDSLIKVSPRFAAQAADAVSLVYGDLLGTQAELNGFTKALSMDMATTQFNYLQYNLGDDGDNEVDLEQGTDFDRVQLQFTIQLSF